MPGRGAPNMALVADQTVATCDSVLIVATALQACDFRGAEASTRFLRPSAQLSSPPVQSIAGRCLTRVVVSPSQRGAECSGSKSPSHLGSLEASRSWDRVTDSTWSVRCTQSLPCPLGVGGRVPSGAFCGYPGDLAASVLWGWSRPSRRSAREDTRWRAALPDALWPEVPGARRGSLSCSPGTGAVPTQSREYSTSDSDRVCPSSSRAGSRNGRGLPGSKAGRMRIELGR